MLANAALLAGALLLPSVSAHITIFHPSMWGFNVSGGTDTHYVSGDNRPAMPLMARTFSQWWWHGLKDFPPHAEDVFQLPVGQTQTVELACDKGASSYWASSAGSTALQAPDGNSPCPGAPLSQYHTNGINDLGGCALAVAYTSDAANVKPDDFAVFSVQHQCVWTRFTDFEIPAAMPPCPDGKCLCTWNWIHKADSGSEQIYQTPFQCNFKGATGTKAVAPSKVPRRCGADPDNGRMTATPSNCTVGAKTPMYWYQLEGNNMFEGTYTPPLYNDLYGFANGAQNDIFGDGAVSAPAPPVVSSSSSKAPVVSSTPAPAPASTPAPAPASTPVAVTSSAYQAPPPPASSPAPSSAPSVPVNAGGGNAASSAPLNPGGVNAVSSSAFAVVASSSSYVSPSAAPTTSSAAVVSSPAPAPSSHAASSYSQPPPAAPSSSSVPVVVSKPSTTTHVVGPATSTLFSAAPAATTSAKTHHHHHKACKQRKRATLADLALVKKSKLDAALKRETKAAYKKASRRASGANHHARRAADVLL